MYEIVFQDFHIDTIKRITGIIGIIFCIISLILNIVTDETNLQVKINVILLITLIILLILTIFIKNKYSRHIQIIIFLFIGIITLLFSRIYFLGDLIYVTGILFLYIYRIINIYNKKIFILLITFTIILRALLIVFIYRESILADTIAAVFIITILSLIIYIFQKQLAWYTLQSYKNEQLLRIGMNAHNLIHEQNMGVHTDTIALATRAVQNKDYDSAIKYLDIMQSMIGKSNRMRELLLDNYSRKEGLKESVFELNELFEFLLQFEYLNHSPDFYLQPLPEFIDQDLKVKGNRYEIASLFQIIFDNAVESMKKTGIPKHKLYVNFEKRNQTGIITIRDTGNGFPQAVKGAKVDLNKIETTKQRHGGFGLTYVIFLIKKYKGKLTITNHSETGAIVCVELPLTMEALSEPTA